MCAGPELVAGAQIFGGVAGGLAGLKALTMKPQQPPEVVRSNPVADDEAAKTKAAQDAQAATLASRQRARANSLLSRAGGAGDTSTASTTTSGAKATLGA